MDLGITIVAFYKRQVSESSLESQKDEREYFKRSQENNRYIFYCFRSETSLTSSKLKEMGDELSRKWDYKRKQHRRSVQSRDFVARLMPHDGSLLSKVGLSRERKRLFISHKISLL